MTLTNPQADRGESASLFTTRSDIMAGEPGQCANTVTGSNQPQSWKDMRYD